MLPARWSCLMLLHGLPAPSPCMCDVHLCPPPHVPVLAPGDASEEPYVVTLEYAKGALLGGADPTAATKQVSCV
jgi:hypothetical protein